ncbi:ABC transporter substrate-binding protein [Streptococcus pneumoniae]|nr:ABC transporter substrate-binding protein [Streptococcus pneumoniae]
MKFKTFSKSAVLLTASLAVLAACGQKIQLQVQIISWKV